MLKKYKLMEIAKHLFPLNRSIISDGFNESLKFLKKINPEIKIKKIPTGEIAFDWKIPKKWQLEYAYIKDMDGNILFSSNDTTLRVMSYSSSVKGIFEYKDISSNIYTHPKIKDAIPYVTSYYKKNWGFCLSQQEKARLKRIKKFQITIKSKFIDDYLHYGECYLPGKSKKEILFSSYLCHPSMANNELSGPIVLSALINKVKKINRNYSYRFLITPETIGPIAYISRNRRNLDRVFAAFNLTCLGDEGQFSFLESKYGNSYSDFISKKILDKLNIRYKFYSFRSRGSDERQYSGPLMNIPMVSIMKSKYHEYAEYHSSKDDLSFISEKGLSESINLHFKIINEIEKDSFPISKVTCEPFLQKRELYPEISTLKSYHSHKKNFSRLLIDVLTYADGNFSLFQIQEKLSISLKKLNHIINILYKNNLLK